MFTRPLTPKQFIDRVIDPVERMDGVVKRITMNPKDYADIRKFGRDVLDVVTRPELLKQGFMATMFNVQVYVSKAVPENQFKVDIESPEPLHWCSYCEQVNETAVCLKPECVVEHVHES